MPRLSPATETSTIAYVLTSLPPRPIFHRPRPVRDQADQEAGPHRRVRGPLLDLKAAEKAENSGNRYLFEVNSRWTIDGKGRKNIARYFNHSCSPNCEFLNPGQARVHLHAARHQAGRGTDL